MDRQELRKLLQDIVDKDCTAIPGIDSYLLAVTMMDYIGDTDSELRDDLILTILMKWIIQGVLTEEESVKMMRLAADDEHLLKGLGNQDDTVFCRTFSAEVIAAALYRHRQNKYLPVDEILRTYSVFMEFYRKDNDVRGYVEGKGWAHGAAHGADVLDEFARCEEIGYDKLLEILDTILFKVNIHHYAYRHYEDERMITAVKGVLERKLIPEAVILEWINRFTALEKAELYPENMTREINVTSFLKSLYFRLADVSEYSRLADEIKNVIKQISRFSKY